MNTHEFSVRTADGATKPLRDYAGQLLLVVNVASRCGLTPQYEGLEKLHRDLGPKGLRVLGFPCNQFGAQEPGNDAEIQEFCSTTYDVTFPVFAKLDVNGPEADPLYRYLRTQAPGDFGPGNGRLYEHIGAARPEAIGTDEIKWNFTKFVVGRDGQVMRRYEPDQTPGRIRADLVAMLEALPHDAAAT